MLVEITRSRRSMALLTAGAGLLVLQAALACLSYAILTPTNLRASRDLGTAVDWLGFVAFALGLAAVSSAAWEVVVGRGWQPAADLLAATVASLLMTIGELVVAANAPVGSDAGAIVIAIGIGGWMTLALVVAARCSIAERAGGLRRQSDLWLVGSGSLLVLAVATGLPQPIGRDRALPIATGVLFVLAYAGLAATFEQSARRGFIAGRPLQTLIAGLAATAVGYLGVAVAAGFIYGPSGGLTTIRIGFAVPEFLLAVAAAVLALAAFDRLSDLSIPPVGVPGYPPFAGPAGQPPAAGYTPPPPEPPGRQGWGWSMRRPATPDGSQEPSPPAADADGPEPAGVEPEAAVHCGVPLPPDAAFCPRCGQPA